MTGVALLHVGIDFDNTIVCYRRLFAAAASERGLIEPSAEWSKETIRDHLREQGRESEWTELQGYVYGVAIESAPAFSGVREFFRRACRENVKLSIVSHKTQYPYLGPRYDLHAAARSWLDQTGLLAGADAAATPQAFFELTKAAKMERIAELGCTAFVDDLPEFLMAPDFPAGVARILFDPERSSSTSGDLTVFHSWAEIAACLLGS